MLGSMIGMQCTLHAIVSDKMAGFQTLILSNDNEMVAVSVNGAVTDTIMVEGGFRTPAEIGDARAPGGHLITTTVPVMFLKDEEKMAPGFIRNIPEGPKEYFAANSGLR